MASGFAISFSGRIASGKTRITHTLAQALGWPRTGFSDYLRVVMAAKGITEPSREQLQDFGQFLVESDPERFCRNVLANIGFIPGDNILLDGIRHADIQQRIAAIVKPSVAILIHLAADDDVVAKRV
jgi:dephospho-CoA kinase